MRAMMMLHTLSLQQKYLLRERTEKILKSQFIIWTSHMLANLFYVFPWNFLVCFHAVEKFFLLDLYFTFYSPSTNSSRIRTTKKAKFDRQSVTNKTVISVHNFFYSTTSVVATETWTLLGKLLLNWSLKTQKIRRYNGLSVLNVLVGLILYRSFV